MHGGRCVPLLHGHGARGAGSGELPPSERRPGPEPEARLPAQLRTGLTPHRFACAAFINAALLAHDGKIVAPLIIPPTALCRAPPPRCASAGQSTTLNAPRGPTTSEMRHNLSA